MDDLRNYAAARSVPTIESTTSASGTNAHLAWLTLMLALGALTTLTASGHRRQRGERRHSVTNARSI